MKRTFITFTLIVTVFIGFVPDTGAQDETVFDPGQRSRITYIAGDVVIQPSISGNTLEADINMPMLTGDRLACGADGMAELRLGDGINGWLWHETKIEYAESVLNEANQRHSVMKLWYGAIAVRTVPLSHIQHTIEIDYGSGRIDIGPDSLVRVTVESDLTAIYVTVLAGSAYVQANGSIQSFDQGQTWRTPPGSGEWTQIKTPMNDGFDEWYRERENLVSGAYDFTGQNAEAVVPAEYVDQAAALHGYGRWILIQGAWHWAPYVAYGWVPYHHGYWDFVPSWGWIWIPSEPWGWTAYHYGFWAFYFDWGWCWVPNWRWRGHYAHWRYDGRTVRWIAAHPDDDMDRRGVLRDGAIPRNSELAIGIPVEAGQTVDQMLNRQPVQRNAIHFISSEGGSWKGHLPETLKPSLSRRPGMDRSVGESTKRVEPYRQSPTYLPRSPSPYRPASNPVRPSVPGNLEGRSSQPVRPPSGQGEINEIQPGSTYNRQPSRYQAPQKYPYPAQGNPPIRPRQDFNAPRQIRPAPDQKNLKPPAQKTIPSQKVKPIKPVKPPVNLPATPDAGVLKNSSVMSPKGSNILLNILKAGASIASKGKAGKIVGESTKAAGALSAR